MEFLKRTLRKWPGSDWAQPHMQRGTLDASHYNGQTTSSDSRGFQANAHAGYQYIILYSPRFRWFPGFGVCVSGFGICLPISAAAIVSVARILFPTFKRNVAMATTGRPTAVVLDQ